MRLYFDIDDNWYEGYDSYDFKQDVRNGIVKSITKKSIDRRQIQLNRRRSTSDC